MSKLKGKQIAYVDGFISMFQIPYKSIFQMLTLILVFAQNAPSSGHPSRPSDSKEVESVGDQNNICFWRDVK